jgi:hypothetical protein
VRTDSFSGEKPRLGAGVFYVSHTPLNSSATECLIVSRKETICPRSQDERMAITIFKTNSIGSQDQWHEECILSS